MAKFSAAMTRATSSTTLAMGSFTAATSNMRRAKIYDLMFGCGGSPADNNIVWTVTRCTTAGTAGSNVTPGALDAADTLASTIVIGQNHSGDPTGSGASHLTIALNQRATFRWVASPGGELIIPATASNGFKINTPTATNTPQVDATVHFDEQ
jgi:hypothetical protein